MNGTYQSDTPDVLGVMRQYADLREMNLSEVFTDQAAKLSCSNFSEESKGLFQHAADMAPTVAELIALPEKLGWRIKRSRRPVFTQYGEKMATRGKYKGQMRKFRIKRKTGEGAGKSLAKGEISIRIARRFYQAIGWLNPALNKYERQQGGVKSRQKKKSPPALVTLRLEGETLTLIIENRAKNSEEVNMRHGNYVQRAINARVEDLAAYIERRLEERAAELGVN